MTMMVVLWTLCHWQNKSFDYRNKKTAALQTAVERS